MSIALCDATNVLASPSDDGTLRLWLLTTGSSHRTAPALRPADGAGTCLIRNRLCDVRPNEIGPHPRKVRVSEEFNRVEVVRWIEEPGPSADQDDGLVDRMQPAARARHAQPRTGLWRRTLMAGHEALAASSEAIAVEVDTVAERMVAALDQRQSDRRASRTELGLPSPGWEVDEIEVSFGVQLTGEASVAMFSGSTEASAQIVLRFSRTQSASSGPPAAQ